MIRPLYIYAILSIEGGDPPNCERNSSNKAYNFMPLGGNKIYTIDLDAWTNIKGRPILTFFPEKSECNILFDKKLNSINLIALTTESQLEIPGRGLVILEQYISSKNDDLIDLGYDVIDLFGLSALANIGYSEEELCLISSLNILTTNYGLIKHKNDAIKFVKFSNNHILEHAPFLDVKIKGKI